MVSKFQCHMEDGLFHVPVADVLDIGDRILQWGSLLDRKRNELRNYHPSPTTSAGCTVPVTDLNTMAGGSHKNTPKQGIQRNPKIASSHSLPREPQSGVPYMHILWQGIVWIKNSSWRQLKYVNPVE